MDADQNKIILECSPNTFNRITDDTEYTEALHNQLGLSQHPSNEGETSSLLAPTSFECHELEDSTDSEQCSRRKKRKKPTIADVLSEMRKSRDSFMKFLEKKEEAREKHRQEREKQRQEKEKKRAQEREEREKKREERHNQKMDLLRALINKK